jgi:multidrug efflux pump subunit AcrB
MESIVREFVDSKLTPLVVLAAIVAGIFSIVATPREEEPQIVVPMIDVSVSMRGASPLEIAQRVTRPLERSIRPSPATSRA